MRSRSKKKSALTKIVHKLQSYSVTKVCITFAIFVTILGLVFSWQHVRERKFFPFRYIHIVTQAEHLVPHQLAGQVAQQLEGGFFTLNTKKLQQVLKMNPWIQEVAFRRVWPDTLEVIVTEQKPVVAWNRDSFLNAQGKIFTPLVKPELLQLVQLSGPNDQASEMLAQFVKLQNLLHDVGATITGLELNSHQVWQMKINNQFQVVLGRQDIEMAAQRFALLYSTIVTHTKKNVVSVDMRYPNGAAIEWQ